MKVSTLINTLKALLKFGSQAQSIAERQLLLQGKLLSNEISRIGKIDSLSEVEFKVFSQWGDDGIIQWLVSNIKFESETFVEFGVEDYRESNTRFLLINNNWKGMVIDGSESNVRKIKNSEYYWKYDLTAVNLFVTKENINDTISAWADEPEIGILHIDIDGNDYWIWKEIDSVNPVLVILEYNSVFGPERNITVPYREDFLRTAAHYSNLFFGASLGALTKLSNEKGYKLIGCNSAGNNAYYLREDKLNGLVSEVPLEHGYVASKMRESRDLEGRLSLVSGNDRLELIRGLSVVNVDTGKTEEL